MKKNIFIVLDRLYLSLSVIILGIVIFVAFQDVSSEFRNSERFERAHSNIEKIIPLDSELLKKLSLSEARELRMFLLGRGLPGIRFHDLRATWVTILL